ncbi:hypothetical protein COU61_00925 [Candidatus Pacearchaeota archaeon CG10_big_fil_rev_8_21_14_0_10_35_13]|nr:MAG: hypothetical protein COU61_00925 [Candidatus Pacearchaeota archaeon CG10_big_fil_rev_8_21_14_0_10_35_13]
MKNNKKGVSGIVTTVLLILVAITAVALIAAFLVPFIKGTLGESKDCLSVLGKVEVVQGPYTCYDATGSAVGIRIGRSFGENVGVSGFAVVLGSDSKSKRYDVISGGSNSQISEFGGSYGSALNIPADGEQTTYVFDVSSDFGTEAITNVEVSAILPNDKVCTGGAPTSIPVCSA